MAGQYYKAENYRVRQSVGHLIRRAGKLITARVEAIFAEQDISFVQYVALMYLRDDMVRTASEIGQRLCHDSGAMTRVIDQLEERGLLTRERSRQDRRIIELQLTPKGRATVESLIPEIAAIYNELLADFSVDEADTLVHLLTKLLVKLAPGEEQEA